jgi:CRP/FNR family transcriptional regulator, dissimilatory nitrate respiration regulator
VRLPGPLQEIASELGLTREALYRTIASLEQTGAIERTKSCIRLKKSLGA